MVSGFCGVVIYLVFLLLVYRPCSLQVMCRCAFLAKKLTPKGTSVTWSPFRVVFLQPVGQREEAEPD